MAEAICGLNTSEGCFCDGGYCNHNCLAYEKATNLYNKGYRKASDMVMEIIEIIESTIEDYCPSEWHKGYNAALKDFASLLKKKYT